MDEQSFAETLVSLDPVLQYRSEYGDCGRLRPRCSARRHRLFRFQFPFLPSTTAQLNTTPGTSGGDPRLFNQTGVASDFHNPYSISYGFGIQQELKNTILEARYVEHSCAVNSRRLTATLTFVPAHS